MRSLTLAAACSAALIGVAASHCQASRPLLTSETEPTTTGKFYLEFGLVDYWQDDDDRLLSTPTWLNYGLVEGLELTVGGGFQFEHFNGVDGEPDDTSSGILDITVGGLFEYVKQSGPMPSQAVAFYVTIPTADEDQELGSGEFNYDLIWLATYQFNDQLAAHFNIGYAWIGDPEDEDASDILYYSVAATYMLTDAWEPVAEVLAETPIDGGPTSAGITVGTRYWLSDTLFLDAAIGTKLANDWADLTATAGVTWEF